MSEFFRLIDTSAESTVMITLFVTHATLVCVSIWLFAWYYIVRLNALNHLSLYEVERTHPPIPSPLRSVLLIIGLLGAFAATVLSFQLKNIILGTWDTLYFSSVFLFSIAIAVLSQVKNATTKRLVQLCLTGVLFSLTCLFASMFA